MRSTDTAVNFTGMGESVALWSVQMPQIPAANPSITCRGYVGFDLAKSTHKATVRPAGLPRGSTG